MSDDSDLDDLLDEFADEILNLPDESQEIQTKPEEEVAGNAPAPEQKSSKDVKNEVTSEIPELDDEFARELKKSMESMFQNVDDADFKPEDISKLLESLAGDLSGPAGLSAAAAAGLSSTTAESNKSVPETVAPSDLKSTISQTMDRLNEQKNMKSNDPMMSGSDEDMLANLIKELQLGGEGDADPDDFIQQMIKELTDKDILYDGMKDMKVKLDDWLRLNSSDASVPKEDMDRYKEQQRLFTLIVNKYESPDYKDNDEATKQFFTSTMMEIQTLGSPPADLVSDRQLADMLGVDQNAGDCNMQ